MKKWILFDLDGTLSDSAPGITTSVQQALIRMGYPDLPAETYRKYVGPPLRDAFARDLGMGAEEIERAMTFFEERYASLGKFESELYPGTIGFLNRMRERGYCLAVASSKPEHFVEEILDHFGLMPLMDDFAGATADESVVEKPDIIRMLIDRQGLGDRRADMLMVGDRKFDILGARETGIAAAGVLWGYGEAGELEAAGADYVAASFEELEEWILEAFPPFDPS